MHPDSILVKREIDCTPEIDSDPAIDSATEIDSDSAIDSATEILSCIVSSV